MPNRLKLSVYEDDEESILLSKIIGDEYPGKVEVCYGVKKIDCKALWKDDAAIDDGPIQFGISTALNEKLKIPGDITFQYKWDGKNITIGPTIGLLFGRKAKDYTPGFMVEHYSERIASYPEYEGLVIAYSINSVQWNTSTVTGLYYNPIRKEWIPCETTIPKTTYRRHIRQLNLSKFREKLSRRGGMMFNSIRYSKWRVHQIVRESPLLRKYLPPTILMTDSKSLLDYAERHRSIIVKPVDSSQGKGIVSIKRFQEGRSNPQFQVTEYMTERLVRINQVYDGKKMLRWIESKFMRRRRRHVVQRMLPIATIDGAVFDIRVIMQKSITNEWFCAGIECRLADPTKEIANLSAGGSALSLEEAVNRMDRIRMDPDRLKDEILFFCKEFCRWMDQLRGQSFAEYGLDLALDRNAKLWFIEANFRPGCKGFKSFDPVKYHEISKQPLRYAAAVQGFSVH
ncbi:YheC/YheD family protein [Paenibacillus thermotolerans]|uniref:YheC/YheD family endospore coat-associated protein n=1 Tax=Paenibacillus thermotolerans TaxID=3027807 RepID=UPI0023684D29|nr:MULTISPECIES: YheC/YheD family protein [unclassified Paenibacillus]